MSNENDNLVNQDIRESKTMLNDKTGTYSDYESNINSSEEVAFDDISLKSTDTRTTKEHVTFRISHR